MVQDGVTHPPMDPNQLRLKLIDSILRLPDDRLLAAFESMQALQGIGRTSLPDDGNRPSRNWPHSPPRHSFNQRGTYMVTTGTYDKAHFLCRRTIEHP